MAHPGDRKTIGEVAGERLVRVVIAEDEAIVRLDLKEILEEENRSLEEQLEVRKLVDRAKGKLMDECKLSEYDAFRFIQTNAMRLRLTMKEVALQVIDGQLWPERG